MDAIEQCLQAGGLYLDAAPNPKSLDGVVTLRCQPVLRVGDIYRDTKGRRGLEHKFKSEYGDALLDKLGVTPLKEALCGIRGKEYSPTGTRDVVDYLCKDKGDGRLVVVEIKIDDGEKRAVEQLLRYLDLINNDTRLESLRKSYPRAILVTGRGDPATRHALRTLDPLRLVDWHIYGFVGGKLKTEKLDIERAVPAICPPCGRRLVSSGSC